MNTDTSYPFPCERCGSAISAPEAGSCTTNYAVTQSKQRICYACCAKEDIAYMEANGKIALYLTGGTHKTFDMAGNGKPLTITNWPGSLTFKVDHMREGSHNIAGRRYDVWFTGPNGTRWHGVQYGNNTQICHCKRIKG